MSTDSNSMHHPSFRLLFKQPTQEYKRIDDMEAALSHHWVQRTDLVSTNQLHQSQPRSQPSLQPARKMALWLASLWNAQPCLSLFVETKSVRSSGSNVASIFSILLVENGRLTAILMTNLNEKVDKIRLTQYLYYHFTETSQI